MTNKLSPVALSIALAMGLVGCNSDDTAVSKDNIASVSDVYLQYVNPFIGTGADGHTFPGAVFPSGMVQLSPDTEMEGWGSAAGYFDHGKQQDIPVYGFSHTHLSGTGITDLGDILVLPFTEKSNVTYNTFDKANETATAGYYAVELNRGEIKAELTTTARVGYHKYTFAKGSTPFIKFDLDHTLNKSWGNRTTVGNIEILDEYTIRGQRSSDGWANNQHIYFYAQFNQPIVKATALIDGVETEVNLNNENIEATKTIAYLEFAPTTQPLELKVGLSPTGVEGAENNLNTEVPSWGFDGVLAQSQQAWHNELAKVEVEGGTEDQKEIFYTAMYHASIAPMIFQDVDGKYRAMRTQEIKEAGETPNYSVYSMWDTFRAFHPLQTIINPQRATEYANDLIRKYKDGGMLPKWELQGHYTCTMIGFPAISIIADAMAKDLNVNAQDALEAAEFTARYHEKSEFPDWTEDQNIGAANVVQVKVYEENGFVHHGYWNSASYTLEFAYGDWAVSEIARMAGDVQLQDEFLKRADNWLHHWDKETSFLRPKNHPLSVSPNKPALQFNQPIDESRKDECVTIDVVQTDGSIKEMEDCPLLPFDPYFVDEFAFTEGNAWQWKFQPMHDFERLKQEIYAADMAKNKPDMTPEKSFREDLDELFTARSSNTGEELPDLTGYIGQYMHGNEPSHHIPYLYNLTDEPWKAQEYLDQIMNQFYTTEPTGLIGNEDVGQMSAWYIMSALGFYQVTPADPSYSIGRPLFDKVSIDVKGGEFTIVADNNSPVNKYVQSVTINGQALGDNLTFKHSDIKAGGELRFVMTGDKKQALQATFN
ncbi:alpha-mannosidase [Photobacterium kishitanii]|uniref:Glycoside hydrolase family 92 protein n=1 Tax=Photobacterium kishitanii TaxID=318456 RepID=A0AAX0YQR2_9GAMM|nr:GH92 family glycosyl hydrolase [Photobacterium kishitanii]KJG55846.1 alpha-mannosidase [Photobacterium kishitanii]KJG58863.1 alpha-mannosidase [Photobacterium kishitanii]KJG64000.1 alpha-mannosidase [Photobacterium kishitanii]KJG68151.1 alpha-mannosidase [Photobacterium kishitanii]PSX19034.1 glycoside hydrolase family 92 protein [Photobacterium kishitanii]